MEKPKYTSILSPQQQSVLSRLLPVARIATDGTRKGLPVHPRTHSLVIGPSGSGKSFLARELGSQLGLPTMVINVSSWVVLSARNEPWTFSLICQWLDSLKGGGILVLDEMDKLHGTTHWESCIRLEAHDLLDGAINFSARIPSPGKEDPWDLQTQSEHLAYREMLATKLRERVFILGCGAWQSAWNSNAKRMGFSDNTEITIETPDQQQITESIQSELRQRFRNEVCWMPPMGEGDYQAVAANIAKRITHSGTRHAWNRLVNPAIEQAIFAGLGMRVFEELMLSALLEAPSIAEPTIDGYELPNT